MYKNKILKRFWFLNILNYWSFFQIYKRLNIHKSKKRINTKMLNYKNFNNKYFVNFDTKDKGTILKIIFWNKGTKSILTLIRRGWSILIEHCWQLLFGWQVKDGGLKMLDRLGMSKAQGTSIRELCEMVTREKAQGQRRKRL